MKISTTEMDRRTMTVYNCIKDYIHEHGYAPTYGEIADITGLGSKAVIHRYIKRLVRMGMITQKPRSSRTLRLT